MPPGSKPHSGYAWCAVDTPKEASGLYDQQVRDNCLQHLELASNLTRRTAVTANVNASSPGEGGEDAAEDSGRPFFVGCGFHKPHAPHFAPKEFFDKMPQVRIHFLK
jgi:hypothetical protein